MAKIKDEWKPVGSVRTTAGALLATLSEGSQMLAGKMVNVGPDMDEGFFWYQGEVLSESQVGQRWGTRRSANGGHEPINFPADCHYIDMAHYMIHDCEWVNNSQTGWEEMPVLLTVLACDSYQSYQYRVTPWTEPQPEVEQPLDEAVDPGKPGRPPELRNPVMKRWQIERSMDNAIKRLAANAGATEVEIARQLLSDALERREKVQEDAHQNR